MNEQLRHKKARRDPPRKPKRSQERYLTLEAMNMLAELRRVRAVFSDVMPCCNLFCMEPAEFEIVGGSGHFEDSTLACAVHVGELLGTPDWLVEPNDLWIVAPIASAVVGGG